jgi:signal recognition particle subunit SRP54
MFENLTERLQETFRKMRGQARLSDANVAEAMQDIRLALLDADVNYEIVKEFVEIVRTRSLGADVLRTITPGQQFVKIVHDNLVELMGEAEVPLNTEGRPAVVMMVGLHGSGKTTSAAKLAASLRKKGKNVLLVAGDVYRPAAIDQLEVLGGQIEVPVYLDRTCSDVPMIAENALREAKRSDVQVMIIDTAGRLQIDEEMVRELIRVKQVAGAGEILLVADAALGQQAVSVADHFHKALSLTGIVLTKLDGDARGGAALSIRKVTGCPIKFVGVGEKIEDLEVFYPDRMASRILGMGDIVSLVEKAAEEIDREEAEKLREKLRKSGFDFNDFLSHLNQMKRMGGVEKILKMLPGGEQLAGSSEVDLSQFRSMEAMIHSMTPVEREEPDMIDFPRRRRIARGSGTSLEQVAQLIKQFSMMRKMMRKTGLMNRLMSGNIDFGGGLSGVRQRMSRGSNFTPPKKKRKKGR